MAIDRGLVCRCRELTSSTSTCATRNDIDIIIERSFDKIIAKGPYSGPEASQSNDVAAKEHFEWMDHKD